MIQRHTSAAVIRARLAATVARPEARMGVSVSLATPALTAAQVGEIECRCVSVHRHDTSQ